MSNGVVVFDLDLTLGDFRVIDYFGIIYEPTLIAGRDAKTTDSRDRNTKIWNNYYVDNYNIENFLLKLRDTFENALHTKKHFINRILRPDLKEILEPLVKAYNKNKIEKFIIYSNNASMYSLHYAGREINRMLDTKIIFEYLDRTSKLRDAFDGDITGARTKKIKTIKNNIGHNIKKEELLFLDDMIPKHEDFHTFLMGTSNYINIPPYYSEIKDEELDAIWKIFEDIFTSLLEENNLTFSDIPHIKNYLKISSLEELKEKYIEYSHLRENIKPYIPEDKIDNIIDSQIKPYINYLSNQSGGRKKKRTRKIKHRYTKRVRNYTEDSDLS